MIRFECDYGEGCHPQILKKLAETNFEQTPGYGCDHYCEEAAEMIRKACECPEAGVHFLVGGTQANAAVIKAALKPWQGAVCAESGHINVHECGAVETTGHKCLTIPSEDGTITVRQIMELVEGHYADPNAEHMVQPGIVYISHPTENGTLYTKQQLTEISEYCRKRRIPLFLDGARLGYGLMAPGADLTLADVARLCDVFYIGGTKVGAMFGEAVVITDAGLNKDFRSLMKQQGAMLAKGRMLGIQFGELFRDGLYFEISRRADLLAHRIKADLISKGYSFLFDSITNQQFPIFPNEVYRELSKEFSFSFWQKVGETHSAVRICTSWATREEDVEVLLKAIPSL